MKQFKIFLFACLLVSFVNVSWAQDFEPAKEEDFYDKVPPFIISPLDLGIFGLTVRYMKLDKPLIEGFVTGYVVEAGGGYWNKNYYYTETGEDYSPVDQDPDLSLYKRMNFTAGIGILQGIMKKKNSNFDSLSLFLIMRSIYYQQFQNEDEEDSYFYQSGLKEIDSIWINSLVGGINFNNVDTHKFRLSMKGIDIAFSIEGGISFCPKVDETDGYMQTTLKFTLFQPIIDRNEIAVYFGYKAMADYIFGSYIPQNVLQRFGGREYTPGLGVANRGVFPGQYPGRFKAISNMDIRINFPDVFGYTFVPALILFYDVGISDNMKDYAGIDDIYHSVGAGCGFYYGPIGCIVHVAYNLTDQHFGSTISFGAHF